MVLTVVVVVVDCVVVVEVVVVVGAGVVVVVVVVDAMVVDVVVEVFSDFCAIAFTVGNGAGLIVGRAAPFSVEEVNTLVLFASDETFTGTGVFLNVKDGPERLLLATSGSCFDDGNKGLPNKVGCEVFLENSGFDVFIV